MQDEGGETLEIRGSAAVYEVPLADGAALSLLRLVRAQECRRAVYREGRP